MELTGKTVLITGASQGIGRYLATYFAPKAGCIFLAARNEAGLRQTADMVARAGGRGLLQPCDLRLPHTLEQLAAAVQREVGAVDILINNAGDLTSKPLLESSLEDIDHMIRTNVIGCLQLCRQLIPAMMSRPEAMIVNISSLAGYKPNPAQTAYSVSKRAVNGISDALRAELKGSHIRVMNVGLCSIDFEGPLPRGHFLVQDFARKLERAIERNAPELFMSPVTKWIMRLYALFPSLMHLR